MNLAEQLREHQLHINDAMQEFFVRKKEQSSADNRHILEMIDELETFMLRGGKRLRSFLASLSYRGVAADDAHVPNDVLVSLEFLHGYLLIHDDIMDRDEQRYGGSTVWASYFQNLQGIGDDERRNQISEGLAILGGDLLSTFMREPILHSTVPADRKVELLQVVHDGENDTAKGQILDVYSSISMPTCDEVRELYRLKTSRYSIAIPLLFGAVLAGDEQHQNRTAIIHYADPLGIAFQIYDDLLGVSGDPSVTGKSDSTDLHQQKKTMLIITTIEHLPPADQAQFLELFYKERKEPADITRLKEMIAISQARETLEKEMQGLIVEAKAAIDAITWNQEAKDMLFQFADFVVRRRR